MILFINTTQNDDIIIAIKDGNNIIIQKKIIAEYSQAEKLLPLVDKLLKQKKIKMKDIKKIKAANINGGFTALRIGVATANALGYALCIPVEPLEPLPEALTKQKMFVMGNKEFNIVKPIYNKDPNISQPAQLIS